MIKEYQLHGTIYRVLPEEKVGCVGVTVHISVNEDHFIEGTRYQLCYLFWLETILFQLGPAVKITCQEHPQGDRVPWMCDPIWLAGGDPQVTLLTAKTLVVRWIQMPQSTRQTVGIVQNPQDMAQAVCRVTYSDNTFLEQ